MKCKAKAAVFLKQIDVRIDSCGLCKNMKHKSARCFVDHVLTLVTHAKIKIWLSDFTKLDIGLSDVGDDFQWDHMFSPPFLLHIFKCNYLVF